MIYYRYLGSEYNSQQTYILTLSHESIEENLT